MSHNNLVPVIVFALFVASVMSALVAFRLYKKSRTQLPNRAVKVVLCMVVAILFAFGAVWAMLAQPR
jgi:high-affinity Fe2+/Pb2+ permease